MKQSATPMHFAIIMDGNERWARENNRPLTEGHMQGAQNAWNLVPTFIKLKIPYVTLYSFSSENWQRSDEEKAHLMEIFSYYLNNKINELNEYGVRLKVIGRLKELDQEVQNKISSSMELTKNNNNLTLVIAFGYGGRGEIVDACQAIIDSGVKKVNEEIFQRNLYDPEMPSVDMMIRTGRTFRISNFLLWQLAYAEMFFLEKYWPDFSEEDLISCIENFQKRERRFGKR